ncbi:MAG: FAD-binding and (Fe-S)-binding domain-containing protein [Bacteroidota bacterium]
MNQNTGSESKDDQIEKGKVSVQQHELDRLAGLLDGELFTREALRRIYSTDASAYREMPLAVARPKHEKDIRTLVLFARGSGISLIPRAAGTSLAGQVVGNGIVVDISRHMTEILEINPEERRARVQPGVILDELNLILKPYGLFFSPETSTSNRCMIGGMIGNNSCGSHSLVYGSTRDHLISVRGLLSDGTVAEFGPLSENEFEVKKKLPGLEGEIYRGVDDLLHDPHNQKAIREEFPDPRVSRRNTGYALDELLDTKRYTTDNARYTDFNLSRLIAGSEGTLMLVTEATLHLDPLPPPVKLLVPVHLNTVMEAIRANLVALSHHPVAVELMDRTILDCTKGNITQRRNRFFVEGDPGAILIVEFAGHTIEELLQAAQMMEQEMRGAGLGYHFPRVSGADISRVWALRKAGLGVLSNIKGDGKPVSVIEDTSVRVDQLEAYISDFNVLLEKYGLSCVYHAHISVGELHLRPVLNLKSPEDVELFHTIALETARLVKKYRGSLSGEHGDGRLRGEFIPIIVGEHNMSLMRAVKKLWDPATVFNRGKITDSPPMNSFLRYEPGREVPEPETIFDFSESGGIIRHIEQCNGSADCRKTELTGGTMCPSYMATREEWNTTRARANILREYLSDTRKINPFDHREIYEVLDQCLSCKACKSECPSSVDMARLKAEFLQHWYDQHGIPIRTRMIAYISTINRLGSLWPWLFNGMLGQRSFSALISRLTGFATERSLPRLSSHRFSAWCRSHLEGMNRALPADAPLVYYFVDEFTEYNDAEIGIITVRLLNRLGIRVQAITGLDSARTFISKGLIRTAQKHVRKNLRILKELITEESPMIGTEPSAILGFRDEYPDLAGPELKEEALKLSPKTLMLEEYLVKGMENGLIRKDQFTSEKRLIRLHGHCQQKAVASTGATIAMLSIPENYSVSEIPSGCCGMAGSFGYEKEHYALSMKVGELVLFPDIRKNSDRYDIVAAGTSCRHQIKDGTGVAARHPAEILYEALA